MLTAEWQASLAPRLAAEVRRAMHRNGGTDREHVHKTFDWEGTRCPHCPLVDLSDELRELAAQARGIIDQVNAGDMWAGHGALDVP